MHVDDLDTLRFVERRGIRTTTTRQRVHVGGDIERTPSPPVPLVHICTGFNQNFAGEVNLNSVQRGALMTGTIGYWIDQGQAGQSYIAEGVVTICRYALEDLGLHRIEICIVPRNSNSRRVMEKLEIRDEGTALRFLEINGVWEDHVRYAITAEEWNERRDELSERWL